MDQFKFDFSNYLKTVQPSIIRIIIIGILTLGFMVFMEVGFYGEFTTMTIVECSGNGKNGTTDSMSLDNCFLEGVPECLNGYFNTNSKYSLNFPVSLFGLQGDEYSGFILLISFVCFLLEVMLYLALDYLLFLKRKRIQNILAGSKIFIEGEKKHEVRLTIFLLVNIFIFMGLKVVWIYWRNHQYGDMPCNGLNIHLSFGNNMVSSISLIVQFFLTYIFFPLMYFIAYVNLLSDLDFKNMMSHLSYSTVKQFKNITIFDIFKYQDLIDRVINEKYQDRSVFVRFIKSHTFTFYQTTDEEICEILLQHKALNPHEFKSMLYSGVEGVDISINNIDDGRSDLFNDKNNNNNSNVISQHQSQEPNEKTKLLN
ncbi:hypothetical protein RB653_002893 [Dictyostelium firmibasis]|uniref:Uncharacterized protein n=1 Tax=Dictyostelium firmibasis TaxID=79012 RepID=A0AAN7TZ20_9MYCE